MQGGPAVRSGSRTPGERLRDIEHIGLWLVQKEFVSRVRHRSSWWKLEANRQFGTERRRVQRRSWWSSLIMGCVASSEAEEKPKPQPATLAERETEARNKRKEANVTYSRVREKFGR